MLCVSIPELASCRKVHAQRERERAGDTLYTSLNFTLISGTHLYTWQQIYIYIYTCTVTVYIYDIHILYTYIYICIY